MQAEERAVPSSAPSSADGEKGSLQGDAAQGDAAVARASWRRFAFVEWANIDPVPPDEQRLTNWWSVALLWFSANVNVLSFATGTLAPVMGLGLRASLATIVGFTVPCSLAPAYFATFGPKLGMRQMVQCRYSFGVVGASLVALLNAVTGIGYTVLNATLAGETLQAVSPHQSLSATAGIVIITVAALVASFCGIRVLSITERYLWVPVLISFAVLTGEAGRGPHGLHDDGADAPAATSHAVLGYGCVLAGYQMTWAAFASDVSLYIPRTVASWKVFLAIFAAFALSSPLILMLGAAFAASARSIPAWDAALNENASPGPLIDLVLSTRLGNFGKFLTVLIALSAMGNIMATLYSIGLSCQTMLPPLTRLPRFVIPVVATAVVLPLAIVGQSRFYDTLTDFVSVISYWAALYIGVVVADHIVIRRRRFSSYDPSLWNRWRALPPGAAAVGAAVLSLGLVIPCMDQTWFTGPLGRSTGDLGFEVGLVLSFAFASGDDVAGAPLAERLVSKVWKVRLSAYEELAGALAATATEGDPLFDEYARQPDALRAMVLDANAAAQEKGVEAVLALVQHGGHKPATRTREAVLPAVAEKCLGSMRTGTRRAALDLVLQYVEMEDTPGSDGALTDLIAPLASKQPKVVAASVAALREVVGAFGPEQVNVKLVLKQVPVVFAHADKNVRAEGTQLALALYQYIGSAMTPTLSQLKDIQAKELEQRFADVPVGATRPTRFLLSRRPPEGGGDMGAGAGAGAGEVCAGSGADGAAPAPSAKPPPAEGAAAPPAPSAYDLAEPCSLLASKSVPAAFLEQVCAAKWQERKDALDAFHGAVVRAVRVLPDSALDAYVQALQVRVQKDANINVVAAAARCLAALADAMRADFARYLGVLPTLLEKLKERKQTVIDALEGALDAAFRAASLGSILDAALAAAAHKNPAVKGGALRFLVRCLQGSAAPPRAADVKPLAAALVDAMRDGAGDVRDAGAAGLAALVALLGERAMRPYIDPLDDIKKAKVREAGARDGGGGLRKGGPGGGGVPGKGAAGADAAGAGTVGAVPGGTKGAPAARALPAGAPAAPGGARAAAAAATAPMAATARRTPAKSPRPQPAPSARPAAAPAATDERIRYRHSAEDAEAKAAEMLPAAVRTHLGSSNWKDRLQGAEDLQAWTLAHSDTVDAELLARSLAQRPGWRESNFQVQGALFRTLQGLAERAPSFDRAAVALTVAPLCEKLGDLKLKAAAGDALLAYGEATSFAFVLAQAIPAIGSLRAPKACAEALAWVEQAVLAFGVHGVDVRALMALLETCLKSANAGVRAHATQLVGTLARYVGGGTICAMLGDGQNAQLRAAVDAEVARSGQASPPAPTRGSRDRAGAGKGGTSPAQDAVGTGSSMLDGAAAGRASTALAGAGGPPGVASPTSPLPLASSPPPSPPRSPATPAPPRVDVDTLISAAALAQLSDDAWKVRKEGAESVVAALRAQPRLKGSGAELCAALRARCGDSNLMVRALVLDAIGMLANGLNAGVEPHVRTLVPAAAHVLADAKVQIRQAAARALTAVHAQTGLGPMVAPLAGVLEKSVNPTLREDAYTWLLARMQETMPDKSVDLAPLVPCVLATLDDRAAPVRKASQALLPYLVVRAGYRVLLEHAEALKAASRATAMPLIDAARAAAAALGDGAGAAGQARGETGGAGGERRLGERGDPARRPPPAASARAAPPSAVKRAPATAARGTGAAAPGAPAAPAAPAAPRHAAPRAGTAVSRTLRPAAPAAGRLVSSKDDAPETAEAAAAILVGDTRYRAAREKAAARSAPFLGVDGAVRAEQADVLRQQMEAGFAPGLVQALFSRDHAAERDYLQGLTTLHAFITAPPPAVPRAEAAARTLANSDVIIRYACLRLLENNTSIALKCFEVLAALVDALAAAGQHLGDAEAHTLLGAALMRLGDAKATFRDHARDILRRTSVLFPSSRQLPLLMEQVLHAKNTRARAESLGEVGCLIARHGLQVCTPAKTLPLVARQIGDRDAGVRGAALQVLGEVYRLLGEGVWRYVGELSDRDASMLEERLRRLPAVRRGAPGGAPGGAAAPAAPPGSPTPAPRSAPAVAGALPRSPHATPHSPHAAAQPRRKSLLPLGPPPRGETPLDAHIDEDLRLVRSTDAEESIGALKAVQEHMANMEPVPQSFVDTLAENMVHAWERTVEQRPDGEVDVHQRYVKHVLQTILVLLDVQNADGGPQLREASVEAVLAALVLRLMDVSTRADAASQTLSKHLNAVVLRVLSTCAPNVVYAALFSILADATKDIESLRARVLDRTTRFAELIIKCLWKVARRLPAALQEQRVNGAQLLASVESFLQHIPPVEWGRRAQRQVVLRDIPLITATNVLKQVVDTLGEESLTMLDALADPEGSHVYRYLLRLLYADEATPESPGDAGDVSPAHASPDPAAPVPAEDALNAELRGIFDRISQKDLSRAAIRELYEFQRRHPSKQAGIERSLQNTGPIFQRYIKRALANHAAEVGGMDAGHGAGSARAARGEPAASPGEPGRPAPPNAPLSPAPSTTAMDARLAELKAKFGHAADSAPKGSAASEVLRQRLATLRTE
ncbi:hypothetical protein MSPP1_001681 [Malassezia sp. CBS 17886]|nr:hypothetical protein MSPP1_001681 [Malassezia sp. CBS 17886]